jgi:hypothetical protein
MTSRFDAARIKLDRANRHVAELEQIVLGLPTSYAVTTENNDLLRGKTVHYIPPDTEKLASNTAVIIGDAVHNCRISIEYSYMGAVERHAPAILDHHTKLPVGETRKIVEDALKSRKVDELSPHLFRRILEEVKPYSVGGNGFIKYLHDLDVSDKHWLLIPILQVTWIKGIVLKDEQGNIEKGSSLPVSGPGPYVFDFSRTCEVIDTGKIFVEVVFGEAAPLKGSPVLDTLRTFSKIASHVIQILEST